jgi:hypothetical protein
MNLFLSLEKLKDVRSHTWYDVNEGFVTLINSKTRRVKLMIQRVRDDEAHISVKQVRTVRR